LKSVLNSITVFDTEFDNIQLDKEKKSKTKMQKRIFLFFVFPGLTAMVKKKLTSNSTAHTMINTFHLGAIGQFPDTITGFRRS